jgi:rhomboid protease GluP
LIYVRMVFFQGPSGVLAFDQNTLIRFGAHWREATEDGQFWRISTAMFLHAGLMHIAFNLFALMQVGPFVEQIFGKGRMLFLYMVTGIIANIGSELWISHGLAIGASGAIMGLIGVAAGWGQRNGTSMGQNIRNQMVKWLVYTVVFGFFIGADNAAHLMGFISGALFGYFYKPKWGDWGTHTFLYKVETGIGILLAGATVFLVFFPPA